MVVHDLDLFGTGGRPAEAHAELVVHPNTVLPGAVTLERFEPIPRRHSQVFQPACDFQLAKFASSNRLDTLESLDSPTTRKGLGLGTLERDDHLGIVTLRVSTGQGDLTSESPPNPETKTAPAPPTVPA